MLLVVVLDGADPGFLGRHMSSGAMPVLAQLAAGGVTIPLGGPELELEHGAWHALLSGQRRSGHGHHHYRELVPGTYRLAEVQEPDLQGTVLGAAARAGRRVVASDLPGIVVSAEVDATQLQGWGSVWGAGPASHPPELLGQIMASAGPPTAMVETGRPSTAAEDAEIAEQVRKGLKRRAALHRRLLLDRPDVAALGIQELHRAGHQLWRHHQRYPDGAPELAGALDDLYRDADLVLADLLEIGGPATDVVVLAAVGLRGQWPVTDLFDAVLTDLGYRRPSSHRGRRPIDIVRRVFPEAARIAVSRRFRRDVRERLLVDGWARRTDWAQTSAVAIPSEYTGYIRVNLRGREPNGTIEPGPEYHELLDRLTEDLLAVHAPEIDGPLVDRVLRTCEVFETGGPPWRLPDLIVHVSPSRHLVRRVEHRRGATTVRSPEFLRSSHHDGSGLMVAGGPSVASAGELPPRDALDVAPTLHELLGLPAEGVLSGQRIEALLAPTSMLSVDPQSAACRR